MNYNEQLKRIKLFMNYDSKKTLNSLLMNNDELN